MLGNSVYLIVIRCINSYVGFELFCYMHTSCLPKGIFTYVNGSSRPQVLNYITLSREGVLPFINLGDPVFGFAPGRYYCQMLSPLNFALFTTTELYVTSMQGKLQVCVLHVVQFEQFAREASSVQAQMKHKVEQRKFDSLPLKYVRLDEFVLLFQNIITAMNSKLTYRDWQVAEMKRKRIVK